MIVCSNITHDAIARMEKCPDARLHRLMTGIIAHIHDFVREYQPTDAEWEAAIDFLTRTGKMCSDERQEFILLSDVLGVSMLVDAVNRPVDGGATESTVFGPFYSGEQTELPYGASILRRDEAGERLFVEGTVGREDGSPLADAKLEVWQTAPNGLYDVQDGDQPKGHLRGTFRTDTLGRYSFETVRPVSYPVPGDGPVGQLLKALGRHLYRPAHIHFMISAPGHRKLVTHLFMAGDPYLASDTVFGVKPSLVVTPTSDDGRLQVRHDFLLMADIP
ncbi:MAG TPA: dioxygenase [Sphingobium sp.]